MINGSFVFGMDDDDEDVFQRTVDWAIEQGITTATFHIHDAVSGHRASRAHGGEGRMTTDNWDLYDTRHVVYRPARLSADGAEGWLRLGVSRVLSMVVDRRRVVHARHAQAPGEALRVRGRMEEVRALPGTVVIRARQLRAMTPMLEAVLSKVSASVSDS